MIAPKWIRLGQDLIEGRRRGGWILAPLSFLWGLVAKLKHWLYDHRLLFSTKVNCPVVSVGNIVAGGTGKTPLTLFLIETFSKNKIAVLSRGESIQGPLLDEPALLKQRAPSISLYLGKNRADLAKKGCLDGAELILLDDGFQHRKLDRDFDLILLSTDDPFGKGRFLPWGYLRDPPSRLTKAHAIFLNPIRSEEELIYWENRLNLTIPLIGVSLEVEAILGGPLNGVKVALFCGIAKPERFKKTVSDLGAQIVAEWFLSDHERGSDEKLADFATLAKGRGATTLVCTEKDFVKNPKIPPGFQLIYLKMGLKITAGKEKWEKVVAEIGKKIDNYSTYGR